MIGCSREEHDAIRTRVDYFMLETKDHERWLGLLTGQCVLCNSTLALPLCSLGCGEACPSTDALPWGGEDEVAHFSCVARVMLSTAKTRFVIVTGQGTARGFVREALAAEGGGS